ncbi:MAG: RNA polymerase subunit sigma-24 [Verrucomicrobiales bacterium]|nr:RNA polymerase subunit sigma-24 [Verrucomicrobiales bacterium]|tara:strand:- start:2687 stop:3220 length:534 start_codon:yes stop_codon:yes gene_type:complete
MTNDNLSNDWKRWFHDNGTRLLLFARSKTNNEQDAQDVLQEAILRLWRSYSNKTNGFSPPQLPLAFTAIRNTAIDLARKTNRRQKREQNSDQVFRESEQVLNWFESSSIVEKERADEIAKALKKIPEKFRDVVTLKIWGGLTFLEISKTLKIPANTAASRYRYALEALRKTLKPNQH